MYVDVLNAIKETKCP